MISKIKNLILRYKRYRARVGLQKRNYELKQKQILKILQTINKQGRK